MQAAVALLALCTSLAFANAQPPESAATPQPQVEGLGPYPAGPYVLDWIKANLIPLQTCEPGSGFSDLQPLKRVVGDARVVSLGEATHGSHEFFRMKHRLLEFLVTELGFNVFAMEAPMPRAADLNRYVVDGLGDPAQALAKLYWPSDTAELLDQIHWMRQYNLEASHTRKLKFYGFDIGDPRTALDWVLAFLAQVDPEQAHQKRDALKPLLANPGGYASLEEAQLRPWAEQVNQVRALLEARGKEYQDKSSAGALAAAQQNCRILGQWAEYRTDPLWAGRVRERAMAENIQWILQHEGPGTRMVVWAHNQHVQVMPTRNGPEHMGAILRKALGKDLVAFGFGFRQGGFTSRDNGSAGHPLRGFEVRPEPRATMEQAFANVAVPLFALDLRKLSYSGTVANWFRSAQGMREMGSVYSSAAPDAALISRCLAFAFDAFIFVNTTHQAKPNPALPRKDPAGANEVD